MPSHLFVHLRMASSNEVTGQQIDRLVYELDGLRADEVRIVEPPAVEEATATLPVGFVCG